MFDGLLDMLGVPGPQTPVPGKLSDEDLERLLFAAMQSGDKGKAGRVKTIQDMRRPAEPLLREAMQPAQTPRSINPFSHINDALLGR